jgi:iron complex transport system ATP-binding protein
MLHVQNVSYRYDGKTVLEHITFHVEQGEFFGILGPNGSGKTTLLKLLGRELALQEGAITLGGLPLASFSPKQLAQQVAVLPQHADAPFGYTVKEAVELGRYAHQRGLWASWTEADERAVQEALAQVGMRDKAAQPIDRLSGGERQRAYLARALAQEPRVLLLDEPTNHMDIAQQIQLLNRLKQWTKEKRLTVVAIFHDMNLASLYCDRLLVLHQGKMAGVGPPIDLIEEEAIERVFRTSIRRQAHPVVAAPLVTFVPNAEPTGKERILDDVTVQHGREQIVVSLPRPFKVLSSAVVGAGFQWATHLVNRHVPKEYRCDDPEAEMKEYLRARAFDAHRTIGMMTAVCLEDVAIARSEEEEAPLMAIVTAGVGNAVDASAAWQHARAAGCVGTINTIVLIEGELSEAAYVQAMMTATEAKAKALADAGVVDPETKTIATGTSTDCAAIAASQTGRSFAYAGTATPLGKAIGRAVYEATMETLENYRKRRGAAT